MADNSSVRMAPSADLETDNRFLTVLSCAHGLFCRSQLAVAEHRRRDRWIADSSEVDSMILLLRDA